MIRIDKNLEIFGAQVETDLDAERGFLSVIKWPEDIESFSLEIWNFGLEQGINEEHFTNKAHQEWFIACKQADAEDEFGMFGAYKRISGGREAWNVEHPNWQESVLDCVDTSRQGKEFVDRLVKAKKFRELYKLTRQIQEGLMDANGATDPKQICIMIDDKINQLMDLKEKTMRSAKELTEYTALRIEEERKRGGASIVTHLPWLNQVLDGGFRAGQLIIVAARPSVGKTTLAMNFAYHAGKKGKTTAIFSLEMSADQLWKKIAAIDSGVDLSKFASGFDNEKDRELLKQGLNNIARLPIHVDDDSSQSIARIRSACKLLKRRGNLDSVVVDYVGLLTPDDRNMPREQQVAHISRTCKNIAKELELSLIQITETTRLLSISN